jgi:hypothetical protein
MNTIDALRNMIIKGQALLKQDVADTAKKAKAVYAFVITVFEAAVAHVSEHPDSEKNGAVINALEKAFRADTFPKDVPARLAEGYYLFAMRFMRIRKAVSQFGVSDAMSLYQAKRSLTALDKAVAAARAESRGNRETSTHDQALRALSKLSGDSRTTWETIVRLAHSALCDGASLVVVTTDSENDTVTLGRPVAKSDATMQRAVALGQTAETPRHNTKAERPTRRAGFAGQHPAVTAVTA